MSKFSLREALAQGAVPELDTTGREQIEYIDIDLLDSDERNFYELSGIEDLAASIELLGLQQPIRVRDNPEKAGRVIIVSGHRRRAALDRLVQEGKERYRQVPCIKERGTESAAMQELRLIFGNSDTRKMSNADIAKQAERIKFLLYQLKEEGIEFPGRMRDHVAEACQISKSKLARLEVIQKGLLSNLRPAWDAGRLPESVAYRISQEPAEIQAKLMAKHGTDLYSWTEQQISGAIDRIKRPAKETTIDFQKLDAAIYLKQLQEKNERFMDAMRQFGYDILIDYVSTKQSRRDGIEALKKGPGFSHRGGGSWEREYQCMPQYFAICIRPEPEIKRSWTEVWDAMAVIALEREGQKKVIEADGWGEWGCGEVEDPTKSGLYLCLTGPMNGGGKLYWWNDEEQQWEHPGVKCSLNVDVKAWIPCPKIPESMSWNRGDME